MQNQNQNSKNAYIKHSGLHIVLNVVIWKHNKLKFISQLLNHNVLHIDLEQVCCEILNLIHHLHGEGRRLLHSDLHQILPSSSWDLLLVVHLCQVPYSPWCIYLPCCCHWGQSGSWRTAGKRRSYPRRNPWWYEDPMAWPVELYHQVLCTPLLMISIPI